MNNAKGSGMLTVAAVTLLTFVTICLSLMVTHRSFAPSKRALHFAELIR